MELTHDIIDMTYKFTCTFLKRNGWRNIDPNDLAHDALIKLAKAAPVEANYLRYRVWLNIKSVFFEFHTNANTRKHDIFRDTKNLVHAEFNMITCDPDTADATDTFRFAFGKLYEVQPTQFEIMVMLLRGKTVKEIAETRGTSTQAVDELKQKARRSLKAILNEAA
jgi:DNA-directed RNA polymerase specialized sigma24 family protein